MYNVMTCSGWETSGFLGGCGIAWMGTVLIFFLAVFLRVIVKDWLGIMFSQWSAVIGGLLAYFVIVTITGAIKWSLLGGIVGALLAGFLLAFLWEEE